MSGIVRKIINTSLAPKPVGPYNQAVQVGDTLYVSGVVGLDKDTGKLVPGGTVAEAKQVLKTLGHILEAAGTNYGNVVKTTVLLNDMNDFSSVNEVYREYFKEPYPARVAYQVGKLPVGASVEIEAIAVVGNLVTCKM
ncbi:2-iminobutanoate/2-iminopropanoate deaminase [Hetaerina americana]|uniref:2-iminobutanoate/2-iminopropanoate deaminase n=1 Tax=Hetaerina americana TaxID=62018 RepID=UPI003A7F3B5A